MKKVTIIFGSTTGNTETVANMIAKNLNDYEVTLCYVTDATDDCIKNAELILYGCSTWGYGELQDDFIPYYEKSMTSRLLRGKNVAVFGCGDKENFEDVFCEATELIKTKAEKCGANIVCENLKVDCEPMDHEDTIIAFAKSL